MSELFGVFGGTFDPVHFGHLRLAEEARAQLGLAGVLWVPAGQPWHRALPGVAPHHRLAMMQLAVADNPAFLVDAGEIEEMTPGYTVPMLERLRVERGSDVSLVLLLGADAFAGLSTWHRWQALFDLAHLAIAHRPGYPIEADALPAELASEYTRRHIDDPQALTESPAGKVISFAMTQLAISATRIRSLLASGESPRYLLPDAVIDYIESHRLYTQN